MSKMSLEEKAVFWSDPKNVRVEGGRMTDGNGFMAVTCHHKKALTGFCGGCSARIHMMMDVVEEQLRAGQVEAALKIIDACSAARRAERKVKS